nr:integrase, catalytic region, zinc finger, CCHC-type, peptidase aspartic, catalytic [Tanacetum cinerariifolium]
MMLCKQESKGIPLSANQSEWLQDTNEELDEQELEAHYKYMAKIQEVLHAIGDNSGPTYDAEPLEKVDSNIILDSSDMCNNDIKDGQNAKETKDERVLLASLITNLKLYIVQIVLFIINSGCTKHMMGNLKLLCDFVKKYQGMMRFRNDQFAPIIGYGDLVQGNVMIKRVYYVEGLNHNLFSVGQFCYADLEVAFRKLTCFVRDLQGNDLLTGTHGSNLHTIALLESSSPTLI